MAPPGAVTLRSLVHELGDRDVVARFPEPPWTSRQVSSTDPRSQRRGTELWFANDDSGHYVRKEQRHGRTEYVLLDAAGPGAGVRISAASPHRAGILRVYLDGAEVPVLEGPAAALLGGHGVVPEPLAQYRGRGHVMLMPIPYAERCVITVDAHVRRGLYYSVQVRTYSHGTVVQSLHPGHLGELSTLAEDLVRDHPRLERTPSKGTLAQDEELVLGPFSGPAAVRLLWLRLGDLVEESTREVWLVADFDGERPLEVPVGGLLGTGLGLNPTSDLVRGVQPDGTFHARWTMPFARSATVRVINRSDRPVLVEMAARVDEWEWDDRSLHFHARHRAAHLRTQPPSDWDLLTIQGAGLFVGDTLEVFNPVSLWWGGGDEKIRIDGESFPSFFGTGTEDYYGYAYCSNQVFQGLLHAVSRNDSQAHSEDACQHSQGHVTNTRLRAIDAIAFRESLDFDLELWHWEDTPVDYAATTMWYQRPHVGPSE